MLSALDILSYHIVFIIKADFGFECPSGPLVTRVFSHSLTNKYVELYLVFIYLSDLWILRSFLEYKWFYVIETTTSSIKREIVLIENNQKGLRTSPDLLKVKIFEYSIFSSNIIILFIPLLESLDLKYNFG